MDRREYVSSYEQMIVTSGVHIKKKKCNAVLCGDKLRRAFPSREVCTSKALGILHYD